MSGYIFHQSFLHALSRVQGSQASTSAMYSVKSVKKLLPPLDRVIDMPLSWSFRYGGVIAEYLPSFLAKALGLETDTAGSCWHGTDIRPKKDSTPDGRTTAVDVHSFPAVKLERVLKACKEHRVRLTALLNHLASRALSEALRKQGKEYTTFVVELSMNLRKVIPQAKDQMANYPSGMLQTHDVSSNPDLKNALSESDWRTIRRHTGDLETVSSSAKKQPIAMLKYVTSFRERNLNSALEPAETSFGTSNLSVFIDAQETGPTEQRWRITDMAFSQAGEASGNPFNMNVASVKGGPLVITVTWWPGMLGVDNEPRLVADMLAGIKTQFDLL